MNRHAILFAAASALALVALAPSSANAQAAASPAPGASPAPDVSATLRTEGGRRVYVSTATIEVRGEIQRPYAFSLSGRSSLGYTYVDVPVHFIEEIINAVRRAPF